MKMKDSVGQGYMIKALNAKVRCCSWMVEDGMIYTKDHLQYNTNIVTATNSHKLF